MFKTSKFLNNPPWWLSSRTIFKNHQLTSENGSLISRKLPEKADTVVIGGGIAGTSIAYHLAKQSNHSVVLLEKSNLTEGSTWHAAGLVTLYHPGINVKKLHWYSMNFYSQLTKETGQEVGFHRPGSIRLATTPTRVDEMRYQMSRQGWNDAPQMIIDPEQIKELAPILDIEGANILAGLYNPYDGHIDPYSLTQAIAKGARTNGAHICQQTKVTKMNLREDGTWDIGTNHGSINAKRVVNAGGFWARELGKLCGLDLPLIPMEHQYIVTSSVPEVQQLKREIPVLRHLEGSFYLRQERDGLLVGPYESRETCKSCEDWSRNQVPPGFGRELFEPDLDRLQPHLERAMELVPCFANANIQTVVNGPITYTPDVLPMVGPSLLPNLWLAVGFAYGIVHGGGVGKYLADWILNGEPPYDLTELDPARYGKWTDLDYTAKKVKESYGMNTAIGYRNEERLAGRPTYRVSGIYEETKTAGAFMGFHSGWEQPEWYAKPEEKPDYHPSFYRTNWFSNVQREYELLTSGVGIADLSPFAKFIVKGPNAKQFLNYVLAGTVPKEGRTCLVHALTNKGRVYAEFTVTGLPGNAGYMLISGSGSELHDLRHLKQVSREGHWNVQIENISDNTGVLSLVGPQARAVLAKAIGNETLVQNWKFLDAKKVEIGNEECLAIRITYTGELGWEIYVPKEKMKKVYRDLLEAGYKYDIGHFGSYVINTLRMEKGFKLWGNEMNCDVTIFEAGLEGFVQWRKGDFIGRHSLEKLKGEWVSQRLAMLEVDVKNVDPEGNESVWTANRVVGNTTSGCYSPALKKGLAFAYIPAYLSVPGTEVQVELMGHKRPARVLPGPPVATQPIRERREKQ